MTTTTRLAATRRGALSPPTRTAAIALTIAALLLAPPPPTRAAESAAAPTTRPALIDLPDSLLAPEEWIETDAAIDRALAYLAKHQDPKTGAWPAPFGQSTAVTSVSVLAFMSKGHIPGEGPYGETINKGIDHVVETQRANGLLFSKGGGGPMYHHGMSTLMLAEAFGETTGQRNRRVRDALSKAVKLILDAQKIKQSSAQHRGGWRYQPTSADSDMSVTAWQLMSLRAAKNVGCPVPIEAINDAVDYIRRSKCNVGGFAYQAGGQGPNHPLAGAGILSLEICGQHHTTAALAGGDWILKHPLAKFNGSHFFYAIYYCSQAMFQLGGKYWDNFYPNLRRLILANQLPNGSWPIEAGSAKGAGANYSTAMTVLALAVPYRCLPIYQR